MDSAEAAARVEKILESAIEEVPELVMIVFVTSSKDGTGSTSVRSWPAEGSPLADMVANEIRARIDPDRGIGHA